MNWHLKQSWNTLNKAKLNKTLAKLLLAKLLLLAGTFIKEKNVVLKWNIHRLHHIVWEQNAFLCCDIAKVCESCANWYLSVTCCFHPHTGDKFRTEEYVATIRQRFTQDFFSTMANKIECKINKTTHSWDYIAHFNWIATGLFPVFAIMLVSRNTSMKSLCSRLLCFGTNKESTLCLKGWDIQWRKTNALTKKTTYVGTPNTLNDLLTVWYVCHSILYMCNFPLSLSLPSRV